MKHNFSKITFIAIFILSFLNTSTLFASRDKNALDVRNDGLNYEQIDKFILGKSFFRIPWIPSPASTTARDGLGPLFNANTCTSCHKKNTSGILLDKNNNVSRSTIAKLFVVSKDMKYDKKIGFIPDPNYGSQIAINANSNFKYEAKIKLDFIYKDINVSQNKKVTLSKPIAYLYNLQYGKLHDKTIISLRKAPSLVGLGLIDRLSNESILENVDENDTNKDGISGKPNYVYSKTSKKYELGKYNLKATKSKLIEQVASAAFNDMGLTNIFHPNEDIKTINIKKSSNQKIKTFDLSLKRLVAIEFYLKNLKPPKAIKTKSFYDGKKLFKTIGCIKCHIETFTTKDDIKISPYSDFLLHDMGNELGDGVREFRAMGNEWKTTPLWGIGLVKKIHKKQARYLHDGRARSLKEAILWHGGEAEEIRDSYIKLSQNKKDSIIKFLEGL